MKYSLWTGEWKINMKMLQLVRWILSLNQTYRDSSSAYSSSDMVMQVSEWRSEGESFLLTWVTSSVPHHWVWELEARRQEEESVILGQECQRVLLNSADIPLSLHIALGQAKGWLQNYDDTQTYQMSASGVMFSRKLSLRDIVRTITVLLLGLAEIENVAYPYPRKSF